MKTRRVIILSGTGIILVVYATSIIPNLRHRAEWRRTVSALQGVSVARVNIAAHRFARDQKISGSTVPLHSLLLAGYLRPEDVPNLEGRDVAISLAVDETSPSEGIIRVRASDGSDVVLLADGSIQKIVRK
jgi:hypothetical protein